MYAMNTIVYKEAASALLQSRIGKGGSSEQIKERVGGVKEKLCSR